MKKIALVVGVGAYDDPEISDLPFAVADARAVATCLRDACGFDDVVTLVSGGSPEPDHTTVLDALFRFAPVLTSDDLFFFYFAGHGVETNSGTFLLTRNARLRMPQVASVHSAVLAEALAQVACRDRVLVLDACRNDPRRARGDGGNVMSVGFSRDILAVAQAPAAEVTPATCVLFSCRAGERAYEWPDVGQGAFTHFLVEGLRGGARDERGRLTVQGLGRFVEERVPVWARQTMKPQPQTPWSEQTGSLREIVLDAGQPRPPARQKPAPERDRADTPDTQVPPTAQELAALHSLLLTSEEPTHGIPPTPIKWPETPPPRRPVPRHTSEPEIEPPARRLAEENGVDWRLVPGSGEGGRILVRDVLNALTRTMAGDVQVDATHIATSLAASGVVDSPRPLRSVATGRRRDEEAEKRARARREAEWRRVEAHERRGRRWRLVWASVGVPALMLVIGAALGGLMVAIVPDSSVWQLTQHVIGQLFYAFAFFVLGALALLFVLYFPLKFLNLRHVEESPLEPEYEAYVLGIIWLLAVLYIVFTPIPLNLGLGGSIFGISLLYAAYTALSSRGDH